MPDLGRPAPIPPEARAAAAALLESGRLHRYAEAGGDGGPAADLERAMAALVGRRYAVALNSCGSALFLALKSGGVQPGEPVLMNAFTLGPVPGALAHAGARAVLVEITEDLVIDLDDLAAKAKASGARWLMLSHMRGHSPDMDRLMALCADLGLSVVEDCAHTLGAHWGDRPSGSFGLAGCYSFQSGKHVNAGEGGVLVTDDPDIAARATLHSGCYRLEAQHGTPVPPAVVEHWRDTCGNFSLRMGSLPATLALAQLPDLPARVADWNASHDRLAARLTTLPGMALPKRPQPERYAQSSLQFRLPGRDAAEMAGFVERARAGGVYLKWFGRGEGYTGTARHWGHAGEAPRSEAILATLCDLRLPLGLAPADIDTVAEIIEAALP
jgi:dTDP-4-amino-4,6-dideoxygalactose transaminase